MFISCDYSTVVSPEVAASGADDFYLLLVDVGL